ncbi:hypothetical protein [Natrialba sp. PRR66]|uniref:hypothetical protein n=1 Tax=Natrialba sp. PRR66 TaxID=3098146 RepID=UPI002B1D7EBD|nr:hypothetical protein [Natrialba sp. PRR66]
MFPPFVSRNSMVSDEASPFVQAYRDVVVYDGPEPDDVLYEGPLVVHGNGWLELEGDRLLSPSAVHHVDIYDGEAEVDDRSDDSSTDGKRDGGHDRDTEYGF